MKEIKKEIQKVEYKTVFVATDGTEFPDKAECEKYEKSAKGVLMAKYAPMVVKTISEDSLFGVGCEDDVIEIIFVKNQSVVDLLLQIFLVENPHYMKDDWKENLDKVTSQLNNSIGDFLVIGRGYDGDGFWFYGSRKEIIENFSKKFDE